MGAQTEEKRGAQDRDKSNVSKDLKEDGRRIRKQEMKESKRVLLIVIT